MLPRCFALVLIAISSAFHSKAQDQGKSISTDYISFTNKSPKTNALSVQVKDSVPCYCYASPQIALLTGTETNRTYQGIANAACYAIQTSPGSSPGFANQAQQPDSCGVTNIAYVWSITSGNNTASINGSHTNPTVNINVNSSGSFTLQLQVFVTCSSGSSCSGSTSLTETVTVETRRCSCQTAPVTIAPTNKQGATWTYSGTAAGTCSGEYGTSPNLQNCNVQNVIYEWSIVGNGVATISGPTNTQAVNVSIVGNGTFELRLQITTVCSDGQRCVNYNTFSDTAIVSLPKSCNCAINVKCERIADARGLRRYQGMLNGGCTGEYGPSAPYTPCGINKITWHWQINSGSSVVEFVGATDQPTVAVLVKGTGSFSLEVQVQVECNDGTRQCGPSNYSECTDSTTEKICNMKVEEDVGFLMNGGLRQQYVGSQKIERDEYIVLGAVGADYDEVTFTCVPSSNCNETGSKRKLVLNSRVRFSWSITGGQGSFVSLGNLPENVADENGDHVIFKPPFVPLPQGNATESAKTTIVTLFIIDDNPTQVEDLMVQKTITIITKRFKSSPDHYTVIVQGPTFDPPNAPNGSSTPGNCNISRPTWELKTDLKKPEIQIADVPDKDKMVVGEWVVLFAKDQRDPDKLTMTCVSGTCTSPPPFKKEYEDNISWKWEVEGNNGRIVGDANGRYVVYEAPDKIQGNGDMMQLKVRVKIFNPDGLKAEDNKSPIDGEITLKIFRAGVKLDFPRLDWLPADDNEVEVRSRLVFRENGVWKPGLAHQARIHYFELIDVSKIPGVCMNDPLPATADKCLDLFIGSATGHERFPTENVQTCGGTQLFEKARTSRAEKEYSINIRSRDFGAYGFLSSEAALKKKPNYESVPVNYAEFPHPSRPNAQTKTYDDNRVSIPRDIDDNHIADNGWPSVGGVMVPDPANPKEDNDITTILVGSQNIVAGDGVNGDGLAAYEEYRGFKTVIPSELGTNENAHIRTNPARKDLFVHIPEDLSIDLFRQQSGLVVHTISEKQYQSNAVRVVNFNSAGKTHIVDQMGLRVIKSTTNGGFLGLTFPSLAPPNWVTSISIYVDKIRTESALRGISFAQKLMQVTAHELAHGCNVYHHGEGAENNPASFDWVNGLRSGNVSCIMRYDNVHTTNPPEAIGSIFCTSAAGTGQNANNMNQGDANRRLCRGDCLHQFRIAGHPGNYIQRNNANCRNN